MMILSSNGPSRRTNESRVSAGLWALGGLAGILLGPVALITIRDQLRIGCNTYPSGEGAGTWTCNDGIGYLWFAVVLGGGALMTVLLGSLVGGLARSPRAARRLLVAIAVVSMIGASWVLWSSSRSLVGGLTAGHGPQLWMTAALPATLIAMAGLGIGVVGAAIPASRGTVVLRVGAALLVAATLVQPGLGITFIPAAALLMSAAARIPSGPGTPLPPTSVPRSRMPGGRERRYL
jgi:hypothetical protein